MFCILMVLNNICQHIMADLYDTLKKDKTKINLLNVPAGTENNK